MNNTFYVIKSPNDLQHYGVLGMKWGIRRYQDKDGSLTKAGEKRYDNMKAKKILKEIRNQHYRKRKSLDNVHWKKAKELRKVNNVNYNYDRDRVRIDEIIGKNTQKAEQDIINDRRNFDKNHKDFIQKHDKLYHQLYESRHGRIGPEKAKQLEKEMEALQKTKEYKKLDEIYHEHGKAYIETTTRKRVEAILMDLGYNKKGAEYIAERAMPALIGPYPSEHRLYKY